MEHPKTTAPNESMLEKIPSRENILVEIRKRCEGATVVRELSDHDGIYLLEAREQGDKPGEFTDYIYQRRGSFPNKNAATTTVLERVFFENDIPCGGDVLAEHDDATGEWVNKITP